jgi:cytochrome P450
MPEFAATKNDPPDVIAAVTHVDPAPFYRRLRAGGQLFRDQSLKLWVAVGSNAVLTAFAHPALRVRPLNEPIPAALAGTVAGEIFSMLVRMNDGVFHAQHKPVLNAIAAAWRLEAISRISADLTPELLQRFSANDFLAELPVRVVASALGVTGTPLDDVAGQVRTFTLGLAAGAGLAAVQGANDAASALRSFWQKRGLNAIQAAHRIGLMQQSLDASAGLLGNTVVAMQRHPELAASWMCSHEEAREFVAEVARWDAPIQNTRRFAASRTALLDEELEVGDCVLLVLASGNRDADLNDRPDSFDPGRKNRRSLTFGHASHQCPAGQIAIEIAASAARFIWASGSFDAYFRHSGAYLPLSNARVPRFEN